MGTFTTPRLPGRLRQSNGVSGGASCVPSPGVASPAVREVGAAGRDVLGHITRGGQMTGSADVTVPFTATRPRVWFTKAANAPSAIASVPALIAAGKIARTGWRRAGGPAHLTGPHAAVELLLLPHPVRQDEGLVDGHIASTGSAHLPAVVGDQVNRRAAARSGAASARQFRRVGPRAGLIAQSRLSVPDENGHRPRGNVATGTTAEVGRTVAGAGAADVRADCARAGFASPTPPAPPRSGHQLPAPNEPE